MKSSNKTEIKSARTAADQAARESGYNATPATDAANSRLATALDRGNVIDRLFR